MAADELQAIPMESWSDVRLRTIPALRLYELDYPVNNFMTAVREDRHLDVPDSARSFVAVYRSSYKVWRVDLDVLRFTLLAGLRDGLTLGTALERCLSLPDTDAQDVIKKTGQWFKEWARDGLFCGVEL